jgi:SAM-dependent methyltransferase
LPAGDGGWDAAARAFALGPGNRALRCYSDAVHRPLLESWIPARIGTLLKTDLFDEACGEGLLPLLRRRAEAVVGVDVAREVRARACARHPGLTSAGADVRTLPFSSGAFDLVVSNSTLDHFTCRADIDRALAEIHRVLRPGGRLIVTLDNGANPAIAIRNSVPFAIWHRMRLVPYYVGATHGPGGLRRALLGAGFEILAQSTLMHVPRILVRALAHLPGAALADGEPRLLRALVAGESLSRLPSARLTGQFIAVHARKRAGPPPQ